jgi:Ca2+-binding EF-hand superfamily protein
MALGLALASSPPGAVLPRPQGKKPTNKWVGLRAYDEATSRAAFRACDGNGDDRLSIFEATKCLQRMGTLDDPEGFRNLDTDNNGQLAWPEFDRSYREVCQRGGTFRMRPTGRFQPPSRARRSKHDTAAIYLLRLGDKDRDGGLDVSELAALLVEFKLPKETATQSFGLIDIDASGALDHKELLLVVERIPVLSNLGMLGADENGKSQLAGADKDGNGKVTQGELGETLRHLHPRLQRWSSKVFADADTNKNGVLEPAELGTPAKKQ